MDFSEVENELLRKYLTKRYNQPTVILSFLILLENILQAGSESVMSKSEIEKIFNSRNKKFGISTFRRDYLKRQSGDPNNAIDENKERCFFIRQEYLNNVNNEQFNIICSQIESFYEEKYSQNEGFISLLKGLIARNDNEEIFDFIQSILNEKQNDNRRGQNFEIVSFAILKQFYIMRGFNLKRFSTTFANDGGMDFIGENAIYQVTVVMNLKKFNEDIVKLPKVKRILVYKELIKDIDDSFFNDELILDVINLEKLNNHLLYINSSRNKKFLKDVIETMISEFEREFYFYDSDL